MVLSDTACLLIQMFCGHFIWL